MPSSPPTHVCQQRHQLYGRLRQTVDALLPVSRIARSRQEPLVGQARQPVRQDVGGDSLLGKSQKLSVVPAVPEHDVSDDNQTPTVAKHFQREIDRAAGAWFIAHRRILCSKYGAIALALCSELHIYGRYLQNATWMWAQKTP